MPYTDLHVTRLPISAKEATMMTRFAIALLILLMLPMLLWTQRMPVATTTIAGVLDSQIAALHMAKVASLSIDEETKNSVARHAPVAAPAALKPVFAKTFLSAPIFEAAEAVHTLSANPGFISSTTSQTSTSLAVFSGSRFRDAIHLNWETVFAPEIIGFEIERRSQLQSAWEMVGYVRSDARKTARKAFTFHDYLREDGVAYYRLRQIRINGKDVVSPVISVSPDKVLSSFSLWKHSLKPFQNYGTVSFGLSEPSEVKLTLHDRFGNTIATLLEYTLMEGGHHIIPFSTAMLRSGINFLRLHTPEGIDHLIVEHI